MLTAKRAGLSGTALKTIALVLMVLDHIHYFFEFTGLVPTWFSMRRKYRLRSCVWPNPSTVQNKNSGADSRANMLNHSGTRPVNSKK